MHTDSDRRPKLRDQFREAIRVRHYSPRAEQTYWYWIRYFARFRKLRHPAAMLEPEFSVFLSWLGINKDLVETKGSVLPEAAVPWNYGRLVSGASGG